MSIFKVLIHQGSALVYIDDIVHMANSKPHMMQLISNVIDFAE